MFKNVKFEIIAWLVGLISASIIATIKLYPNHYILLICFILGIITLSVWRFLYLFDEGNRKLSYFINSVRNKDTTLNFPDDLPIKSSGQLNKALNQLNQMLKKIQMDSVAEEHYLQAIIDQSPTGLMVRDEQQKIILANKSVRDLCKLPSIYHLNQFDRVSARLKQIVANITPGDSKLENITIYQQKQQLSFQASAIRMRQRDLTLISIRNLQVELDEKEIESWVKLIRVLTHEIMNSLAPITSISQTLSNLSDQDISDEKKLSKAQKGLKVINNQAEGLIQFVNTYRSLTQIPTPKLESFNLKEQVEQWVALGKEYCPDIVFNIQVKEVQITSDKQMLSRVCTNLIKNACEALKNTPSPQVVVVYKQGKLSISNNGPQIEDEVLENIWIPFFTTKNNGSGIGLSLCKQIIKKLNATISVISNSDVTTFSIQLI